MNKDDIVLYKGKYKAKIRETFKSKEHVYCEIEFIGLSYSLITLQDPKYNWLVVCVSENTLKKISL